MKKTLLALALVLGFAMNARAENNFAANLMMQDLKVTIAHSMATENVINWKVGEFANFNIDSSFGNLGQMHKVVASEEGNAIWMNQEMSGGMIGNHKAEALIDRATGQILKLKQDGQDQQIPNDKLEIISQDQARITVPAGTFDTIHIVAKSQQIKHMETWLNPRDTALDGSVQTTIDTGMIPMTLKLTAFGGK